MRSRLESIIEWFESLEVFKKFSDLRDSRKVLFSTNLIIAVCSLVLSGFSAYLAIILYDPAFVSGWISWLGLSIVGLALAVTCIIGMRGAHLVSLDLLLTYFWGITIFVAPLLLGIIACIDFYSYMSVWFKHEWSETNFQGVRNLFCPPLQPDLGKCGVPLFNADAWCRSNYNATDCTAIRETAIATSLVWGRQITLGQAVISIADLLLIGLALFFCYRLLKRNVIAQSMNDVINYLLVLPIGGCVGIADYLWWLQAYPPQRLQYSWLAGLFSALAIAQVCALPLGIAAGRLKSQYLLTCYMLLIFLIATGLALGGVIALLFAGLISQTFQPSAVEIGDIACRKQLNGCSSCSQPVADIDRCPEWATDEVISLLVLDLKIAGIVAFVSLLYLFGAMIVAFLVQQSLENYKNDYVGVGKPKGLDPVPQSSSLTQSLSATVGTVTSLAGDFAGGVTTVSNTVVGGVGTLGGLVGGAVYETVSTTVTATVGAGGAVAGVLRGDRSSWGASKAFGGSLAGSDGKGLGDESKKKSRQVQWAGMDDLEADGDASSSTRASGGVGGGILGTGLLSSSSSGVFPSFSNFSGKHEIKAKPAVPVLPPSLAHEKVHRTKDQERLAQEAAKELEDWIAGKEIKPYIIAPDGSTSPTPPLSQASASDANNTFAAGNHHQIHAITIAGPSSSINDESFSPNSLDTLPNWPSPIADSPFLANTDGHFWNVVPTQEDQASPASGGHRRDAFGSIREGVFDLVGDGAIASLGNPSEWDGDVEEWERDALEAKTRKSRGH